MAKCCPRSRNGIITAILCLATQDTGNHVPPSWTAVPPEELSVWSSPFLLSICTCRHNTIIWMFVPWATIQVSVKSVHSLPRHVKLSLHPISGQQKILDCDRKSTKTPDRHRNLTTSSLGHDQLLYSVSSRCVHNFLCNPAKRQTDRPSHITSIFCWVLIAFKIHKNSQNYFRKNIVICSQYGIKHTLTQSLLNCVNTL